MAIVKFYNHKESLEIVIEMIKEAMKMQRVKMPRKLDQILEAKAVMKIEGHTTNGITFGGVQIKNTAKFFGFDLGLKLMINANLLAAYYENEGVEAAWDKVIKTVRHETWHAYQFFWLYTKGGERALRKAKEYDVSVDYKTNILEIGAWGYEDPKTGQLQDLDKDLAIFLA